MAPRYQRRYRLIAALALISVFSVSWLSEDPEEVGLSQPATVKLRALGTHLRKLGSEIVNAKAHTSVRIWSHQPSGAVAGISSLEICGQVAPIRCRRLPILCSQSINGRSPPVVSI